jgi:antitoxin (DNA-binding transcriptional repressor) of toxin-antitoxin stability system
MMLASDLLVRHVVSMKSATADQVPQQWSQILQWVAAGEEVQVTEHDKVVARLVPPTVIASLDFVARAKTIWGDAPAGTPLSKVVSEARGGGG